MKWLCGLFLLKVAAGCFYGYIHTLSEYYPDKIDTWRFYFQSLPETELLKKDPAAFWQSLFANGYEQNGGLLEHVNSYWNDLKHNIMLLFMSLFNLFSRDHYYINVLFYNFIAFTGLVALYRVCISAFPGKKIAALVCVFLIPTVVFWGSGFHKEGLLLSVLGIIFFHLHNLLNKNEKRVVMGYRLLVTGLLLLFILLLRPYILFALLPALLGWVVCEKIKWKPALVFTGVYVLLVVFFFASAAISRKTNLPAAISGAQHDFLALGGNTTVTTEPLQPNPGGFIKYFPQAVDLAFLRPRPLSGGLTYLPSALENIGLAVLLLLFIFFYRKEVNNRPLLFAFAGYAITLLLLVGYSVPVTGAVIRYKVLAIPFLVFFLAAQTDWLRLKRKFYGNDG